MCSNADETKLMYFLSSFRIAGSQWVRRRLLVLDFNVITYNIVLIASSLIYILLSFSSHFNIFALGSFK